MAKMFYTLEEVREKLGKSAEQIKQLVSEGKLREFRDGAKIMFKVDDVESLGGLGTGVGESGIGLAPEDSAGGEIKATGESGSRMGLAGEDTGEVPSPETEGSSIGLAGQTGSSIGLVPGDSADRISLDETGETEKSDDDTVITTHGVNALDESDSDLDLVDPLAQTQIAPDIHDQVQLDSGSSGSGLLDLTREADDTSLGAELLEEIYPGGDEGAVETQLPTQLDVRHEAEMPSMEMTAALPDYVRAIEMVDPTSVAWGFMMIVPLLMLIYLALISASSVAGVQPGFFETLKENNLYVWVGAGVAALIVLGIGHVVSAKAGQPAAPKAKKEKAKKEMKPKAQKEKKEKIKEKKEKKPKK